MVSSEEEAEKTLCWQRFSDSSVATVTVEAAVETLVPERSRQEFTATSFHDHLKWHCTLRQTA